ncbi:chaplin [Streptomyces sp. NPDC091279]|uniref:chaplin n=1 Tax=unclassified Streptomyces TaxID=2593676 RepID=UPI0038271E97
MRRVTRNGVIAVAAVSGAMAVTGSAFADSAANGAAVDSPGVISGNTVQLPVHVPLNVCGNTVNVVGLLNPAMGNTCANKGGGAGGGKGDDKAGSANGGGSTAHGVAKGSPGVISGNGIQLPVDLPVNVSGNSVSVVGVLNPVFGNHSENTGVSRPPHRVTPPTRPTPATPKPPTERNIPPAPEEQPSTPPKTEVHTEGRQAVALAHTGADQTLPAAAASLALIAGGVAVYRRARRNATR